MLKKEDHVKGKICMICMTRFLRQAQLSLLSAGKKCFDGPFSPGCCKLKIDGSMAHDGNAGASKILSDHMDGVVFTSCRWLFSCRNALEVELCATVEGTSARHSVDD